MTYNIHPLLVHFPIALLFIYSVIKILPFKKWFPKVSWHDIERALLVFGVLGAFLASATGDMAEEIARPNRQLVDMHAVFAALSTWLYGALLAGELLLVVAPIINQKFNTSKISTFLLFFQKILTNSVFSKIVAFLGLVAISVTGLLGGVMVYGVSADPVASIVLKLLGITY